MTQHIIPVRFLKNQLGYSAGMIAAFPPEHAELLIRKGIAELFTPEPVTMAKPLPDEPLPRRTIRDRLVKKAS